MLRPAWLLPLLLALLVDSAIARADAPATGEDAWLPRAAAARVYALRALRTQRFSRAAFAPTGVIERCATLPFIAYRREPGSALSDAWYDASQLMADAALARLGQPADACIGARTVAFLDLLARPGEGGYRPRADTSGENVTGPDLFADDNALIGLALLEARDASGDEAWRQALLERAERVARFLMTSGFWDDTFGGGFWWTSSRGLAAEGKPTQTTGLATLLFARLYAITGTPSYADWARRGLEWLDARLYDPARGLYRYTIRHRDLARQEGEEVDPRLFSYDQGILIETHLLFERALEPGGGHLARARALAERLQAAFWEPGRGYRLVADRPDVFTVYAAWLTTSLLALYDADLDPRWLARARANLDALEASLFDPAAEGYDHFTYRCGHPEEPPCAPGVRWGRDPTKLLVSQAWMQRAQALLAARLALSK